jgi:hypothetical protein
MVVPTATGGLGVPVDRGVAPESAGSCAQPAPLHSQIDLARRLSSNLTLAAAINSVGGTLVGLRAVDHRARARPAESPYLVASVGKLSPEPNAINSRARGGPHDPRDA